MLETVLNWKEGNNDEKFNPTIELT